MKFIDLFAGLGGFHLALRKLKHSCVLASEIDEDLRSLYEKNFHMPCEGDLKRIPLANIPSHDILCAGFPCQPYSKARDREGLKYAESGGLFFDMLDLVKHHKPSYIILENVPNFARHNDGDTWQKMDTRLKEAGYLTDHIKISPHEFGIPQIRERIYIVASLKFLDSFKKPDPTTTVSDLSIKSILDENPIGARAIPENIKKCISIWQEFMDLFPKGEKLPSFPIWSMEFGATYPFEDTTPYALPATELNRYRGSFGFRLKGLDKESLLQMLPSHARREELQFPKWKVDFIRQNRDLYRHHKDWIEKWKRKIREFPSSFQKLEWNCQGEERVLENFVIQIRASGVRVKRPTTAPSLVAMTATQVPIIAWEGRYMTLDECKKLQSMDDLKYLPEKPTKAYQALGNAVNVKVCEIVARSLLEPPTDVLVPTSNSFPHDDAFHIPKTSLVASSIRDTSATSLVD